MYPSGFVIIFSDCHCTIYNLYSHIFINIIHVCEIVYVKYPMCVGKR